MKGFNRGGFCFVSLHVLEYVIRYCFRPNVHAEKRIEVGTDAVFKEMSLHWLDQIISAEVFYIDYGSLSCSSWR